MQKIPEEGEVQALKTARSAHRFAAAPKMPLMSAVGLSSHPCGSPPHPAPKETMTGGGTRTEMESGFRMKGEGGESVQVQGWGLLVECEVKNGEGSGVTAGNREGAAQDMLFEMQMVTFL